MTDRGGTGRPAKRRITVCGGMIGGGRGGHSRRTSGAG